MILYFTYWFPSKYRARVIAALFLAVPGSNAITAAISGALLQLDGVLGLRGWQWLFIVEAVPSVLLAFAVLALMTDRPAKANWLSAQEQEWLETTLENERRAITKQHSDFTLWRGLTDPRVLVLSIIYLTAVTGTYGITFFMPLMLKSLGLSDFGTGLVTAIPYTIGTVGMVLWSISSDRTGERRLHFAAAYYLAAIGLIGAGFFNGTWWAVIAMSVAAIGIYGAKPAFWPLPSTFLTGTAAAGGIALINAIGNLGGFVGPYAVGWIKDATGSYAAGLYFLAGCAVVSSTIAVVALRERRRALAAEPAE
jgi:ACS family tartrate transporter-like MFS transporter